MSTEHSAQTSNAGASRISVIVPHFNQHAALRACLLSLCNQSLRRDEYEIIVCDNASPGGVDELAAAFPEVVFLDEPMRGAACARNKALGIASSAAVAFIDADCVAHPDWLEAGLTALETSDLVGGDVLVKVDNADRPTAVEAFELVFAFRQRNYIERKFFSVTANLFATRAAISGTGLFQNGIAEDLDWCHRARTLGFHLAFNGTAIVSHPARRTWDELTLKWERLIAERWGGVEEQNQARRLQWAGLAIVTAMSAAPHLAKVAFSSRIQRMKDKAAAAVVLVRIRLWRSRRMLALL